MAEKILKSERIVITTRGESNFDRACEEAYRYAISLLRIDDDGHSTVKGWERSSCFIRVVFEKYTHTGSMGGHEYTYIFRGEAVKGS